MSDDADRSDERIEMALADAIARARTGKRLVPCGTCYFCDGTTDFLFCDTDCRDDYDREQRLIDRSRSR